MAEREPEPNRTESQDSHDREPEDTTTTPDDPSSWPPEHGGQAGPEPTRYGDWEKGGRCTDF